MWMSIDEAEARLAFGLFVRRRRQRLGWSQRSLERVVSIDQTVISRIENGRLRFVRLHQVAKLLCVLAPEILEIRVWQDGSMDERMTWEPVRPFEPPILAPPVRGLHRARPSRDSARPRGRRPAYDVDQAELDHLVEPAASFRFPTDATKGIAIQDMPPDR